MKHFEDKWQDREKITFFLQGWEPEDEKPRALVLLVHGLGEQTARYAHVGKALTRAGYALAGFDLHGHGKSGGPRGHASSLDAYLRDIRQFLSLMEQRFPAIPRFLYGHSLGGLLVLAYAIQYDAGLKGVIATGPALRSSLQEQKAKIAIIRLFGSLAPAMTLESGLDAATISRDPAVVEAYKKDPLIHYGASLGFGKAALNAIDICFARAAEFPVPLLIMHGTGDRIVFFRGSEDFARLVSEAGRDVTLKLWNDLYHEVHNEPEKEKIFQCMIEWLDKRV